MNRVGRILKIAGLRILKATFRWIASSNVYVIIINIFDESIWSSS